MSNRSNAVLKDTKVWLRIRLVDNFLRQALYRDLNYEIQETLSMNHIILRLLVNQIWRGDVLDPQLNRQQNTYFEGYKSRDKYEEIFC